MSHHWLSHGRPVPYDPAQAVYQRPTPVLSRLPFFRAEAANGQTARFQRQLECVIMFCQGVAIWSTRSAPQLKNFIRKKATILDLKRLLVIFEEVSLLSCKSVVSLAQKLFLYKSGAFTQSLVLHFSTWREMGWGEPRQGGPLHFRRPDSARLQISATTSPELGGRQGG